MNYSAIVIILSLSGTCLSQTLKKTFHIHEEIPQGSVILGNISDLFNLHPETDKDSFKLLSHVIATSNDGAKYKTKDLNANNWVEMDDVASGQVKLGRRIDRDDVCGKVKICCLQIQVIRFPQQQLLEIFVFVDDINDHFPEFPQNKISFYVNENTVVGETFNLDAYLATDGDSGVNGEVRYSLTENPYFEIKHYINTGGLSHLELVLVQSLDYESIKEIDLTLTSSDRASPSLNSTANIKIIVADVNDNRPIFLKDKYSVSLKENQLPYQEIIQVKAVDADSGPFGAIRYYISKRNTRTVKKLLSVDPNSGKVMLKEKLDRERDNGMRVLIVARDSNASGQRDSETYLVINVEDINDNAPLINVNYVVSSKLDTAYVNENAAIGTYIARVSATDADDGNNGRVTTIISSKAKKISDIELTKDMEIDIYFILNTDGFIETLEPLNLESCSEYVILISACDHGEVSRCAEKTINIVILDVNEYAPKFEIPTYHVSLKENVPTGTEVVTVNAIDRDNIYGDALSLNMHDQIIRSRNGEITYSIVGGGRGMFTVDSKTGRISTLRKLDREVKNEWKLTILAEDGGIPKPLESICDVHVKVDDINDNLPYFINPAFNNSLVYASLNGNHLVTRLRAKDADTDENANLKFNLISTLESEEGFNFQAYQLSKNKNYLSFMHKKNAKESFVLNPVTGDLTMNTELIHPGLKHLQVEVCDFGFPKLCSNILLRVMVTKSPEEYDDISSELIILAACLGTLAVLLLFAIPLVVLRCKKENKKIKSYGAKRSVDKNSRCETFIQQQSILKQEMSSFLRENELENSFMLPERNNRYNSWTEEKSKNIPTISSPSDGDSGRGDSEPENSRSRIHSNNSSSIRDSSSTLSKTCTDQCLHYGHSDECWMPKTIEHVESKLSNINQFLKENSQSKLPTEARQFTRSHQYNLVDRTEIKFPLDINQKPSFTEIHNSKPLQYLDNRYNTQYSNILTQC